VPPLRGAGRNILDPPLRGADWHILIRRVVARGGCVVYSALDAMKVFFFHLMPWPYLPADFDERYDSAWVWCPNSLYDPAKGHDLYAGYIDLLAYAEELGFDGVCVNEHHQNAYGLMPSPNLIAAALTQRTKTCKIAVVGNALPLYNPPVRIAEEWAMLDVMSGGRLIAGMVVGGGPEYFSYGVNPTEARGRFREAHDLIIRAWTEPGPFEFRGRYYRLRYVNPWPVPLQKPHPPIWIPGMGSLETMDYVAERRYGYMGIPFFHADVFKQVFAMFREACARHGYTPAPEQMGWGVPVYVSTSDDRARKEFEPHLWYFAKKLMKGITLTPPGYTSPKSAAAVARNLDKFLANQTTWKQIEEGSFAIVGSPATVRDKILHLRREIGAGVMLTGCQAGSMPNEMARASMELFAAEVLPHIRESEPVAAH
jgi:alkanesulfonate monooxygenase SsuD/methylene tetrahydromethanopterin reductase-like flavin-dependent oxidoreductase (luciferase family)